MIVKVYLSCCGGDKAIETVKEAIRLSGIRATLETVTDFADVAKAGILSTPAIQINDKVVISGRLPKVQDLVDVIMKFDKNP